MSLINTRTAASYWGWQNPGNADFGEVVIPQGSVFITDSQRFDPNTIRLRLNDYQIQTAISGDGNFFVMVGMTVGYSGSISNPVYGRKLYISLYEKKPTGWVKITSPVMKFSAFHIVRSVSLNFDGSVMAIGFTYDDGASTDGSNISYTTTGKNGIVNVFNKISNVWNTGTIIAPVGSPSPSVIEQLFGQVVVLSNDGKRLALSNPGQSRTQLNQGVVYVYDSPNSIVWYLSSELNLSTSGIFDGFGATMTMSGDGSTIAASGYQSNKVLIFVNGSLTTTLVYPTISLSLNGNGTVLSVSYFTGSTDTALNVLKLVNSVWTNDFTLSTGTKLSSSKINFDGNLLIIGDPCDTETIQYQGSFSIYSYTNSTWTDQGKYFINPGTNSPYILNFGYNINISNDGHNMAIVALSQLYPNIEPTKIARFYYCGIVP
jgi:hypothetical protein